MSEDVADRSGEGTQTKDEKQVRPGLLQPKAFSEKKPRASVLSEEFRDHIASADFHVERHGLLARHAQRIARNPCKYLWGGLIASVAISAIGMIAGEFSVSVEAGGWQSRGTLISKRQTQLELAQYFADDIFFAASPEEEERVWDDLLNNVQEGWEILEAEDEEEEEKEREAREKAEAEAANSGNRRLLFERSSKSDSSGLSKQTKKINPPKAGASSSPYAPFKRITTAHSAQTGRQLQASPNLTESLSACELEWYGSPFMFDQSRLFPIWKVESSNTALSPEAIFDICQAEEKTQQALINNDLCFGCNGTSSNGCHHPYSIVLFARVTIENGMPMSCSELRDAWAPLQSDIETQWQTCTADILATHDPNEDVITLPESCPSFFSVSFVDDRIATTGQLKYTSTIFATRERDVDELYDIVGDFDRAGDAVKGAYDTQNEDFVEAVADESLGKDMMLAMASAVLIGIAILVHTRSPMVTIVGLLQIILSFPVSFFVYKLIIGLDYFPFLNFIGVFVIFALGADDIFVAFDKFKNARFDIPLANVEDVAAVALPEAVSAMFLTTSTTAVAFFATAICPVAPIRCFAVFLGLLVVFDYILNIVLVFPALCIYDMHRGKTSCCVGCCVSLKCRGEKQSVQDKDESAERSDEEEGADGRDHAAGPKSPIFIRRILMSYYRQMHRVRWPLLVVCAAAFAISCYYASTLELPTSGDVRVIGESLQYEKNFAWRKHLLSKVLDNASGSQAHVVWGLKPADTGDLNNPETWSKLVLDKSFDPTSAEAQMYLLGYCPKLFAQDFASTSRGFKCSIERFDTWLKEQSDLDEPADAFTSKCNGATGLPMSPSDFHPCLSAWSELANETTILSRSEQVQVIWFSFNAKVRFDSEYSKLDEEWKKIEKWTDKQNEAAPLGVQKSYFSSLDFWWYDTNGQMLRTAYGSATIALAAAAAVILFSSRSLVLTIFATLSVGFVLTSVTACLVGIGWTLGFLESICFAILIGISVDFVVHFSHAYSILPDDTSRGERTQYALISMGPSILAAAATSMLSAVFMIFTVITFFQKFAYVLLITILQAVVGSFVVFLTMTDCVGPANPTRLIDNCLAKIFQGMKGCIEKKKPREGTSGAGGGNELDA